MPLVLVSSDAVSSVSDSADSMDASDSKSKAEASEETAATTGEESVVESVLAVFSTRTDAAIALVNTRPGTMMSANSIANFFVLSILVDWTPMEGANAFAVANT